MIIDAHAHVYRNPLIRMSPESEPMLSAAQQIEMMDRLGIAKAIILPMNCIEVVADNQSIAEVLSICDQYEGRFIPYCNIDPRLTSSLYESDTEFFKVILQQYKDLGCRGLGELTAKIDWDDGRLWALLAACESLGFPVTFHTSLRGTPDYGPVDEMGLPRFEKTLQRFPGLLFFGHSMSFWSEISGGVTPEDKTTYPEGPVAPDGTLPRLLRRYPNLYGDLSANSGINALSRDESFAFEFIDEFQDRLVFALDYCSIRDKRPHLQWFSSALDKGKIRKTVYEKIMYKNISNILGLKHE
ncbi:amidohydrolase family protein [candidate division KSB1 bacterium]|nr:amidohydrolase family protein [candidate division KSB1 bacterium]